MKKVVLMLLTISTLGLYASNVSISIERDATCTSMCNTEIAGQACVAKGGAFIGPTWLATEWMTAGAEIEMNTIRIIPTTKTWMSVQQLKVYVKNAEGVIEEKLFNLGLNHLNSCDILNVLLKEKMTIIDIEMFVRGTAESIDIGTKTAE